MILEPLHRCDAIEKQSGREAISNSSEQASSSCVMSRIHGVDFKNKAGVLFTEQIIGSVQGIVRNFNVS
jgi:hypothetical protein